MGLVSQSLWHCSAAGSRMLPCKARIFDSQISINLLSNFLNLCLENLIFFILKPNRMPCNVHKIQLAQRTGTN